MSVPRAPVTTILSLASMFRPQAWSLTMASPVESPSERSIRRVPPSPNVVSRVPSVLKRET
jgi:hypothetical protein